MSSKLREARHIASNHGIVELLRRTISFAYRHTLRQALPASGYYTLAGVPFRARKPLDWIVPGFNLTDDPEHESAIIGELREHVRPGDDVVVVGAGSGTTTVVAANQTGPTGSVVAFEASADRVNQARKTIAVNNLKDRCEVLHAVVGPAVHIPSTTGSDNLGEHFQPEDLPKCDILELDCEGAEHDILEATTVRPRVVIVETHPHFESGPDKVARILRGKEYVISNRTDRLNVPVLTAVRYQDYT